MNKAFEKWWQKEGKNLYGKFAAELAYEAATPQWQEMESAPKDGTEIWVWREDCGALLARWIAPGDFLTDNDMENFNDEDWEEADWFYADFIAGGRLSNDGMPTHWQPLPEKPKQ